MSEEESPTRGQPIHQQHERRQSSNAENDANNSIIEKVKSRVSSIFPQTISKWFSPLTNDSNGGIRRRREDDEEDVIENNKNADHSDGNEEGYENNERTPVLTAPPAKRSRLNMHEGITSFKESQNFRASTPLTIAKGSKRLAIDTTGELSQQLSLKKYRHIGNADDCTESRTSQMGLDTANTISSRRCLNIPSTSGASSSNMLFDNVRRDRLRKVPISSTAPFLTSPMEAVISVDENDEDNDSEEEIMINEPNSHTVLMGRPDINLTKSVVNDEEDEDDVISEELINVANVRKNKYINGNYGHGNVDSTSESGDSRSSSVQKHRVKSGLYSSCNQTNRTIGNGLNFFSHLDSRKSLFSEKNLSNMLNNSTLSLTSLNRRQFNSSLYGSTSALSDSRLLNTFSPFYKGQTTFGGAGAYSKYAPNRQNSMRITPTLIRPVSSLSSLNSSNNSLNQAGSNQSMAISSTAKRILDLINDFSTPLNDAKKMANNIKSPALVANRKRFNDADLASSRAMRLSTVRTPYNRPSTFNESLNNSKQLTPSIRELQVPSMSQLLQMKKLQNSTERAREVGNVSNSILNSEKEYKLPIEDNNNSSVNNHVNKIKNRAKSSRISTKSNLYNDDVMPEVNLPEIPLPFMKTVPKIDIVLKPPSTSLPSTVATSSVSTALSSTVPTKTIAFSSSNKTYLNQLNSTSITVTKSDLNNKNVSKLTSFGEDDLQFKFSMPIQVAAIDNNEEVKNLVGGAFTTDNFKFSSPIKINKNSEENSINNIKNSCFTDKSSTKISSIDIPKTQSPPKLKTGSVLEALKKQTTVIPNETPSLASIFKKSTTKWECEVCMIQNDISCNVCAACTTPKKKTDTAVVSSLPTVKSSFGDAFKSKDNLWECPSCMIRNKIEVNKCVACTTPKPGGILSQSKEPPINKIFESVPNTLDNGFKNIVAQQSAKWECPACMTRNESARTKCVCCEQAKPGCNITSSSTPKFSFGSSTASTKFTFGFPTSSVEQKDEQKNTTQIEKDNNKGFGFGTCIASSNQSSTETITPSTGFKFGFTPNNTSSPATSSVTSFKVPQVENTLGGKDTIDTVKPIIGIDSNKATNEPLKQVNDSFKLVASSSSATGILSNTLTNTGVTTSTTSNAFKSVGGFSLEAKTADQSEIVVKPTNNSTIFGNFKKSDNDKTTTVNQTETTTLPVTSISASNNSNEEKKGGFNFGSGTTSENSSVVFGSKSVTPVFNLGQPAASTSATSIFGSMGSTLQSNAPSFSPSNTPVFGSLQSISSTSKTMSSTTVTPSLFGSLKPAVPSSIATDSAKPSVTPSSGFGSFSLAKNQSLTNSPSNPNVFEAPPVVPQTVTKSDSVPVFGTVTAAATSNQGFSFSAANQTGKTPFMFGSNTSTKTSDKPTTSLFGVPSASENNVNSLPTFGTFAADANNSQQQQQQQNTSSFGQSFGATAVSSAPTFGSNIAPISSGMFGSGSSAPGFGSVASSTFGAAAQGTNLPSFGFGSGAGTATNKTLMTAQKPNAGFNFGAPASNPSIGGFSFGSTNNNNNNNDNNNKPAFNFSSTQSNVPSFNFTGISEPANTSQPFQFGATPISTPVFNFSGGIETTSNAPFQFNAASAAPTNNIFAPTPTPGAQGAGQARRKVRTGTRRLTPR